MNMKKLKGKIGFIDNRDLRIPKNGGHYAYIRSYDNGRCDVNLITSLDDGKNFQSSKIQKVRKGYIYPIPKGDANFSKWSGVDLTVFRGVPVTKILLTKKYIKKRHRFFVGKFGK